jgi:ATP-dependent RNA helicase DDX10/DBP4
VYLQKDKSVFDVNKLPLTEFALSLGLAKAPKIRYNKWKETAGPSIVTDALLIAR